MEYMLAANVSLSWRRGIRRLLSGGAQLVFLLQHTFPNPLTTEGLSEQQKELGGVVVMCIQETICINSPEVSQRNTGSVCGVEEIVVSRLSAC